jgi:hypothetical protein
MDKKSYRNKRLERLNVEFNLNLPGQPSAEEGLSGDTSSGVGRGYAMPGEPVMPAMHSDEEDRDSFPKKPRRTHSLEYDKLLDVLVLLSDEMDKSAFYDYSNFADFLIKKVSQQNDVDYQILLKDLLIKINNSDIMNKQDIIISLIKEYNSLLREAVSIGEDKNSAHRESYQIVAGMVENYV